MSTIPERALEARLRRQRWGDATFRGLTRTLAILLVLILALMFATLVSGAWPALKTFGFGFLIESEWDPVGLQFGALGALTGTLVTSLLAVLIAVPLSFGIAICLTELAPPATRTPLGIAIELLAAIPSLIYGMWGLFVFAPFFAAHVEPWLTRVGATLPGLSALVEGPPMGIGVLSAALILAIMIVPFISSAMHDVFALTPPMLKESAFGLGATTWEVIWRVVVPHSKAGILGGVILGLGRALGETMAVTFMIGNAHELSLSLLKPGSTIASVLANEFNEATGELYAASLVELGLVLLVITLVVLTSARLLLRRLERRQGVAA